MQKSKVTLSSFILSLLLLIFTCSSALFTAHHLHHHCNGEDCSICFIIQISCQNLKLLSLALAALVFVCALKRRAVYTNQKIGKSILKSNTLVSQKVRLND